MDENAQIRYQPNRYQLTDEGLNSSAYAVTMTSLQPDGSALATRLLRPVSPPRRCVASACCRRGTARHAVAFSMKAPAAASCVRGRQCCDHRHGGAAA